MVHIKPNIKSALTQDRLKELVEYDPTTGYFTRKGATGRWNRSPIGSRIGLPSIGPRNRCGIRIDGYLYEAARLAWLFVYGYFPIGVIDHIDCDPANNALSNLRVATQKQNTRNVRTKKNNICGIKGVSFRPATGTWRARISPDKRGIELGSYDCPAAASFAYQIAADKHFGPFSRAH